ncbi:MAG: KaiC domain-containing protein [Candidatus Methanoperedens sp.]|nr:KaiC domain-containing protein [Candidatus Methanoperedens sp.]MCE8426465.1 KaiC domain-containing protein [Candidatus Methanoperedens sp.]MCE8429272.1 KaiC domain-containing protein [Candidatus Methanoperedens sp.]
MELLKTGIIGLDDMILGGIPKGHIVAVMGPPGTGKSTFSLQFIYTGLKNNENCIYLSLEESEENIIKTASIYGWDMKPYITNKKLALVNLSTLNFKSTIDRVENELPNLIKLFHGTRFAIDPITLYEMIHDSEPERRNHLFNFARLIKETGITAVITSEISKENPFYSRYGLIEYIADGVIILRQVRPADMSAVTTVIEISKMRHTDHSKEVKPYNITKNGIVVHSGDEVF